MRELTLEEIDFVSGAGYWQELGGAFVTGAITGAVTTKTWQGALGWGAFAGAMYIINDCVSGW